MSIASVSIKRPIFITSIVILLMALGILAYNRLGVDLYPDVTEPGLIIITTYAGAAPEEIETLVSKPIEDEMSSLAGLKRLTSTSYEGLSFIIAEFSMSSDIKYLVQQTTQKISRVRSSLPDGIKEPQVYPFTANDMPIIRLAVMADLPPARIYDLANDVIKPRLEQVDDVATVKLLGGTKREIQVELDRSKLNRYGIPALTVAGQIQNTGMNIPVGKHDAGSQETVFRTIGNFETIRQIEDTVVLFSGDVSNAATVASLGTVTDSTEDATSIAYLHTKKDKKRRTDPSYEGETASCIVFDVQKQSGSNTVKVTDGIMAAVTKINESLKDQPGNPRLSVVYDNSKVIRSSLHDVRTTMLIGILLAVIVVYLFLGNIRSTIITGIAIPNSLLGAFLLMYAMDFTVNMLTLLALSLTVGLLVDDAIVVRENIFRKLQSGLPANKAAEEGTTQVMLAVIATSLTIIAVFLPIGFMQGVVGQYFKQFGLTIVFAMAVSLFDALTVAPFLSAYFAGSGKKAGNFVVQRFDRFQDSIDRAYAQVMRFALNRPGTVVLIALAVFAGSIVSAAFVKSTFMPDADDAEYQISLKLPPGTSLAGTETLVRRMEAEIRRIPELDYTAVVIGNDQGQSNVASIGVFMVPYKERKKTAPVLRNELRTIASKYPEAKPSVNLYNLWGGDWKPYILNISSDNLDELNAYTAKLAERLKKSKDLMELELSGEGGKPEFQISFDSARMRQLGVNTKTAGAELRYQIAGEVVGKFHQNGKEYDIRLRLKPEQRNLKAAYAEAKVPNMHYRLIPLSEIAEGRDRLGPSQIMRQDRERTVQIMANWAPGGAAGSAMAETQKILEKEMPLPKGFRYSYWGDAEALTQTVEGIALAFLLSFIFIFLILSSLYESFVTPVTIILAIPPALSGAFFALLVTGRMLDIFSMIGIILLMGLVTKNSILLVDYAVRGVQRGLSRKEAVLEAGRHRLRPILMTTFAMIAGTAPVAIGIGEAGKTQSAMGIAILGGLVISTLITLIVVPAVFEFIDVAREKAEGRLTPSWKKALRAVKKHAKK
jgi:HAE1 family hydrophobic/amphiphilic exporter-1